MQQRTETVRSAEWERLMEDLRAVVRDGQQLLNASVGGIKNTALKQARNAEQSVRDHPTKSMAIVFGLGVLVGVLAIGLMRGDD